MSLGVRTVTYCPSDNASFASTERVYDNPIFLLGGRPLTANPGNPNLFQGTWTAVHDEQPRPGGSSVIDATFNWSLQRRP
jgi:hypothetical protein